MIPVPITDEIRGMAVDALYAARDRGLRMHQAAACVLADTHRLVAAAELRRLADELDLVKAEMRETDSRTIRSSGLGEGILRLRARADELERGES